MTDVAILGASGYTALELIKILLRHPEANISALTTRQEGQPHIAEFHPSLTGRIDLVCESLSPSQIAARCECVFSALPHTASMAIVPELLAAGCRVVDLSGDHAHLPVGVERARVVREPLNVVGEGQLLVTHGAGVVDDPQDIDLVVVQLIEDIRLRSVGRALASKRDRALRRHAVFDDQETTVLSGLDPGGEEPHADLGVFAWRDRHSVRG